LLNSTPTGASKESHPNRKWPRYILCSWVSLGITAFGDNPNESLNAATHGILPLHLPSHFFSCLDANATEDIGNDEVLRRLDTFRDLVRKHSASKKIRSEHAWWPLRSKPAEQFKRFSSSVLLCDQLGVSETKLAEALGSSTVTEKRITQHAGGSFFVRKFHNLDFVTVLQLGSDVTRLEYDVVPSHETIANKECSEVNTLRQSIMRCRTRSDIAAQEKVDSCANVQKRKRQEDGTTDDTGKTSKEQDRKEILGKQVRTMTLDQTALFVDRVFATIESLCGMIDKSRSEMVRASVESTAANFNSGDSVTIDLTTLLDDETPADADDLVPPVPKRSRFHQREMALPSGATVEGATAKTPNNCSNLLLTASDIARFRKERKKERKKERWWLLLINC
jgi:hypothetical protein